MNNPKKEEYLNQMYESVQRMNEFTLEGNLKKVHQETEMQKQIKKLFFSTKNEQ